MLIKQLVPYETIEGRFVVKFKKPVISYAKGYTFQLRIGDTSGEIMLRYWGPDKKEEVERLYNSIKKDNVIEVKGESTTYNNRIAINVNPPDGFVRTLEKGEYAPEEFLPKTEKDIEVMFRELVDFSDSVKNPGMKKILEGFLKDRDFAERFKGHPAAMYRHQGWIGGLLEHTLNVVKICDFLTRIHPELDRDLVLTGAILHDIGKLRELEVTTNIKTSVEGMLLGHLVSGIVDMSKKLDELETPEEIRVKIMHIMASHHGKKEYGTPKEPAFPEALAIYMADEIDSKLSYMIGHIQKAETEDDYIYIPETGIIYLK